MATYQVWALNDDYSRAVFLANAGNERTWSKLEYGQELNAMRGAVIDLVPSSSKIASLGTMKRILIYRDGAIVFGGLIVRVGWEIGQEAPQGDTYQIAALDYGCYAKWRVVIPDAAAEYDEVTDHLDDAAKAYVANHAGSTATVAARQFSDLTVEADEAAVGSDTVQARYDNLLSLLQELGNKGAFDWRFVPSATGVVFQTAYPYWGLDRTKGNGVNAEMVISIDRRNWREVAFSEDLTEHYNFVYVAGQGEGVNREIVERSTAGDITAYKRRELFVDARDLELTSALQLRGDAKLAEYKPAVELSGAPLTSTWKSGWDLGDQITIYANRYGRTFAEDAQCRAIEVTVASDGRETVTGTFKVI